MIEILFSFDEIDFARIQDEKGRLVIVEEVGVVGFGQFFQVIELHLFFVSDVSRFDSLEKDLRRDPG